MQTIKTCREMREWSEGQRLRQKRIVLVPTMGFFHEGHLQLMREGRKRGDLVVVSIFVNPTQFGPNEDFKSYPRDLERDRKLLANEKVDLLFHPSESEIYPDGYQTNVEVDELSQYLCGAHRPGHFRGVCTVVNKLFNIVRPHVAVFGLKDYQQFLIVRRMVQDLNLDVDVVGVPTVRESDGLAMSSRNHYLNKTERVAALCLRKALFQAKELVRRGERSRSAILEQVAVELKKEPLARVEYIEVCDTENLRPLEAFRDKALLALAVHIGGARLIDHTILRAAG
ncbi:MAG: pantoate--beta-alanine ligase [Deltaproteobacteria bacterium]|nr:pantoate--beta-alanine ligase [Deltaproteobacteria bacterium]